MDKEAYVLHRAVIAVVAGLLIRELPMQTLAIAHLACRTRQSQALRLVMERNATHRSSMRMGPRPKI